MFGIGGIQPETGVRIAQESLQQPLITERWAMIKNQINTCVKDAQPFLEQDLSQAVVKVDLPMTTETPDDRITCGQCVQFRNGRCHGFAITSAPARFVMRRCEKFHPKPGEEDQRTGAERWPSL